MLIVSAANRKADFLNLVKEYIAAILANGDDVKATLNYQHLDHELEDLEKKYGQPKGGMYLADVNGSMAGCVAFTGNDDEYCELKRLYVRPNFRGLGLGEALTQKAIQEARKTGYKHMRLDTFDFMRGAIKLYEKAGFHYIKRYNENPAENVVFMQIDL